MPCALFERGGRGAVINGQADGDLGDADVPHDAVRVKGELGEIVRALLVGDGGESVRHILARERGVVRIGGGEPRGVILARGVGNGGGIILYERGAAPGVIPAADERIKEQGKPREEQQREENCAFCAFSHSSLFRLRKSTAASTITATPPTVNITVPAPPVVGRTGVVALRRSTV